MYCAKDLLGRTTRLEAGECVLPSQGIQELFITKTQKQNKRDQGCSASLSQ